MPLNPYPTGTFCWSELHSNEQAASRAFYTQLFKWETAEVSNPHGGTYTTASITGQPVAGIQDMDAPSKAKGGPSYWLNYLAVNDVDAYTKKAEGLGATVVYGPFDVAELGRAVVLKDPVGASIALWQAGKHVGAGLNHNEAGSVCWFDHYTNDLAVSKAFYCAMFDYETESHDIQGMELVQFTPKQPEAEQEFVMMNTLTDRHPYWQPFFSVTDADTTLAKAVELGAQVICPVMDAGESRFAHFIDPQGASFGIFEWEKK